MEERILNALDKLSAGIPDAWNTLLNEAFLPQLAYVIIFALLLLAISITTIVFLRRYLKNNDWQPEDGILLVIPVTFALILLVGITCNIVNIISLNLYLISVLK
jgi:hypothetical protein